MRAGDRGRPPPAYTRVRLLREHLRLPGGPGDELVPASASIRLTDAEMAALRRRYDAERDKRFDARADGRPLYDSVAALARASARFRRVLADPYPQIRTPHPLRDDVEVCVIGAGYGGLCAGARLVEAGVDPKSIRLIDKAGDVGGTWYWNRYPGAMCDVEAYVYMPLCEEVGYIPTMKYAHQPEILAHSQLIARKYGLYENASFGAEVNRLVWDEAAHKWTVTTDRGDDFRARFVVMNFGTFTQPKIPSVPGIGSFEGHLSHTSRWDYDFTGGSPSGGLDRLRDKRVAIIGTGPTTIQAVPHLGEHAQHLYVFQRTPSSVDIRNNRLTTAAFAREHLSKPGWQRARNENFFDMTMGDPAGSSEDLVADAWTDIIGNLRRSVRPLIERRALATKEEHAQIQAEIQRASQLAQFQQQEKIRRRAGIVVKDAATAAALQPWYDTWCKRPCFHDEYLQTFNRPNVTLVHTDGRGIDRVTPRGVVANGVEHQVDAIVMATGFDYAAGFGMLVGQSKGGDAARAGVDIVGCGGRTLDEKWRSPAHRYGPGPKTYRSHFSAGFPNLCLLNGPQGVVTLNFTYTLDSSARHFAHIISRVRAEGKTRFDVKQAVEDQYVDTMWRVSPTSTGQRPACTPGYYNAEGKIAPAGEKVLGGGFPSGAQRLFRELERERREGTALDAFDVA